VLRKGIIPNARFEKRTEKKIVYCSCFCFTFNIHSMELVEMIAMKISTVSSLILIVCFVNLISWKNMKDLRDNIFPHICSTV
jgi:hypothetical protein